MRLARLDGIRAVAVLLVIFLHHFMGERTGWVGVDIFFVLSGFLITGILMRSGSDRHYWRTFYIKRATRILPPVAVLFVLALLLFHHLNVVGILGYLLFAGNVMDMTRFALAPFVPMWSLAIEEHFYFVWPFIVRNRRPGTMAWILAVLVVGSPLARMGAMWLKWPPMCTYYLTPFRLDGLACGALLGVVEVTGLGKDFIRRWGGWISLSGWSILLTLELALPSFTRESGTLFFNGLGYSLAAWASFGGVGYVAWNPNSAVSKLLALPFVSWIGRLSYGMYLYHGVVLSITRHLLGVTTTAQGVKGTQRLILVDLPLTILLSWISFRLLEKPIIGWGHRKAQGDEPPPAHQFA